MGKKKTAAEATPALLDLPRVLLPKSNREAIERLLETPVPARSPSVVDSPSIECPVDGFDGPPSKEDGKTEKLSEQLRAAFEAQQKRPGYMEMLKGRSLLPAYISQDAVLECIRDHDVAIISGGTGCGKSTQVPQLLLDEMFSTGQGGTAYAICTQPRRIAAVGIAERIADERDEKVGNTVGYSIHLENKKSASTRMMFCTTGVLLRVLQGDPDLMQAGPNPKPNPNHNPNL